MPILLFFLLYCIILPSQLWAGAALVQVQQAKQMRARAQAEAEYQAQMQAMQQQAAMQQAVQVQAAQQYMAQQQMMYMQQQIAAYIQQQQVKQVEEALVYRYVQQAMAQQMAQAQVQQVQQVRQEIMQQAIKQGIEKAMYERTLAQRDAQSAQAYLQMRNEAIAQYQAQVGAQLVQANARQQAASAVGQAMAMNAVQQQQYASAVAQQLGLASQLAGMENPISTVKAGDVKQIALIQEVWLSLDKKSTAWSLLIDNYAKYMTVEEYKNRFRRDNVKINKPPAYYARMIDELSHQNPTMLEQPFSNLMQILSIMEYDFDNGIDKDALAQKVLGPEMYEANKKRLGR